jgi:hypothetical protein
MMRSSFVVVAPVMIFMVFMALLVSASTAWVLEGYRRPRVAVFGEHVHQLLRHCYQRRLVGGARKSCGTLGAIEGHTA